MNRRDYLLSAASSFALASGARAALPRLDSPTGRKFAPQIKQEISIPMRDGIELRATIYLPYGLATPRPAIFSLIPYTADQYYFEGVAFAENGYPYIAVDMRGRGDSDGAFSPFVTDADDSHDIVAWIARQPFCNGKVGMYGLSYVGYTQWMAVRGGPPAALATIAPSAPCYAGFDFPIRYNIFFNFAAGEWLNMVHGKTLRLMNSIDHSYWAKEYLRFLGAGLPYRKMPEFFGMESKPFDEWIRHPHPDEYWDRANPTAADLAGLTIPVLSLCGIYDGDQLGTVEFYREHLKQAGDRANHYLVIGPWGHVQVRSPTLEYDGIKVGPASLIDMGKLHREWYAFAMEDGPRPAFLQKKVAYYVMAADKWRYADTLDGVTARYETLHLHSSVNANGVYRAGSLLTGPAAKSKPDHYVYDPRDLSGPKLEATLRESPITGQTMVTAITGDKLVYHSEPFVADTEVSGYFKFVAWIAIDQPDTDFIVKIYDIAPDGSSMLMTEQQKRARYREGLRTEKLIQTKKPLRYDFEGFFFVSRLIREGHRLRLVIDPNHNLKWQKNYNSGKAVADETMADARTVTVWLHHDPAYPSCLAVPIGQAELP